MTIPVKAADVMCAIWAPVALAAEPMRRAAIPAAFRIREPPGTTTSVFYGDTDNGGHILRVGGGQTGCVEGGYNQFSELLQIRARHRN